MNNLKVKFENKINAKEHGVIFEREFIKQENRLFYIIAYMKQSIRDAIRNGELSKFNVEFNHTGVELIKEGDFYLCNPVIIITNGNEDEKISMIKEINDIDEQNFHLSQNIMVSFLNDLEGVEYHNENILGLLTTPTPK